MVHFKVMSLLGGSAGPSMSSTAAETVIKDFVNFSPPGREEPRLLVTKCLVSSLGEGVWKDWRGRVH